MNSESEPESDIYFEEVLALSLWTTSEKRCCLSGSRRCYLHYLVAVHQLHTEFFSQIYLTFLHPLNLFQLHSEPNYHHHSSPFLKEASSLVSLPLFFTDSKSIPHTNVWFPVLLRYKQGFFKWLTRPWIVRLGVHTSLYAHFHSLALYF